MCTVSFFYNGGNDFILTSNRDEAIERETHPPKIRDVKGVKLLSPQDQIAGGTWIGVSDKSRLLCLLNGAYEKHTRKPPYRKSRGVIVNDLLLVDDLLETLESYNFDGIEPFTLLILDWSSKLKLFEVIWDGEIAYFNKLPLVPMLWCSSTLYTQEMKKIRNEWFLDFQKENDVDAESVFNFHEHYGVGDKNIDLQIDRGMLKTVSITSVNKSGDDMLMKYKDLQLQKTYHTKFNSCQLANE